MLSKLQFRLVAVAVIVCCSNSWAQQIDLLDGLDQFNSSAGKPGSEIRVSAEYTVSEDGRSGQLAVTARMGPGWHVYSVTQPPGGPTPTKIDLKPSVDYRLAARQFTPSKKPKIKESEAFDVPSEEHWGKITWTTPIEIVDDSLDPKSLRISGELNGLICNDRAGCIPLSRLDTEFIAAYAGTSATKVVAEPKPEPKDSEQDDLTASTSSLPKFELNGIPGVGSSSSLEVSGTAKRMPNSNAAIKADISPAKVKPGTEAVIRVLIEPDEGHHVYGYSPEPVEGSITETLIKFGVPDGWVVSDAVPSSLPVRKETGLKSDPFYESHEGPTAWTLKLRVPADASPGQYQINGLVGMQTCTDATCQPPDGVRLAANIEVGDSTGDKATPFAIAKASYKDAEAAHSDPTILSATKLVSTESSNADGGSGSDFLSSIQVATSDQSLAYILAVSFGGGLILNLMPCVLPVIGLKIMSFVQQAGESRSKTFMLNVWYAAGLISVFMVLAVLSVVFRLGWGAQFNSNAFSIFMAAIVFTMGLSFMGVWEIPIPGFATSGSTEKLAQKEGGIGAFFKGVITTIMATPCAAPGMSIAWGWTTGKPPAMAFLVFFVMGLGMASPYLLIGAFPSLMKFIPKPGAWMDTFKQFLGFMLLGTVIYLLTIIDWEFIIPTIALLFGLWMSCWWIGQTPMTAEFGAKLQAWGVACAFGALVGWFAFFKTGVVGDVTVYGIRGAMEERLYDRWVKQKDDPPEQAENSGHKLAWKDYTLDRLEGLAQAKKTIMIDFTADW